MYIASKTFRQYIIDVAVTIVPMIALVFLEETVEARQWVIALYIFYMLVCLPIKGLLSAAIAKSSSTYCIWFDRIWLSILSPILLHAITFLSIATEQFIPREIKYNTTLEWYVYTTLYIILPFLLFFLLQFLIAKLLVLKAKGIKKQ